MNSSHFFSSIVNRLRYGERLDPTRDWFVLITLTIILFAGVLVWNAWAFDTVASGGVIGGTATVSPPLFSQSSLDTIQTVFANRAAEEAKYQTGAYRFVDPSQ